MIKTRNNCSGDPSKRFAWLHLPTMVYHWEATAFQVWYRARATPEARYHSLVVPEGYIVSDLFEGSTVIIEQAELSDLVEHHKRHRVHPSQAVTHQDIAWPVDRESS